MQDPDKCSLRRGSGRVLMLGTFTLVAAAAAVLAIGAQDARLLRLGLVAALWAALFGAFAVARMRREINSATDRVNELRTVYQLELEREVAARREHELTVERELREQVEHAEQAERDDIAVLRTELAAMRVNLENLLAADFPAERVVPRAQSPGTQSPGTQSPGTQSGRLFPLPDRPTMYDEGRSCATLAGVPAKVAQGRTVAGSLNAHNEASMAPRDELPPLDELQPFGELQPFDESRPRFGPSARLRSDSEGISHTQRNGRHGTPSRDSAGSNGAGPKVNGSHSNGSPNNGGGSRRATEPAPAEFPRVQRSVSDLLAANGGGPEPRRRRSREAG